MWFYRTLKKQWLKNIKAEYKEKLTKISPLILISQLSLMHNGVTSVTVPIRQSPLVLWQKV